MATRSAGSWRMRDEAAVVGVLFELGLLPGHEEVKERLTLGGLPADSGVGFHHLAGETGDLEVMEKRVEQSGGARFGELYGNGAAEVEGVEDLFYEMNVVAGDYAACVAGFVAEGGVADVEGEMDVAPVWNYRRYNILTRRKRGREVYLCLISVPRLESKKTSSCLRLHSF